MEYPIAFEKYFLDFKTSFNTQVIKKLVPTPIQPTIENLSKSSSFITRAYVRSEILKYQSINLSIPVRISVFGLYFNNFLALEISANVVSSSHALFGNLIVKISFESLRDKISRTFFSETGFAFPRLIVSQIFF